jgi:hypothetical protein
MALSVYCSPNFQAVFRSRRKRMAAETYVVSVYRRGKEPGKEAAGLVERTSNGERKAFSSSRELWAFLCGKPGSLAKKNKRSR